MKIFENADLLSHNSLRFQSNVDELVVVEDYEDLAAAFDCADPVHILGEGTNSVLMPHVRGRVVEMAIRGIRVIHDSNQGVLVHVAASENWHEVVRYTLGQGIHGLENLSLIPGSVGAAPYQNIGAYGVELHEVLESVQVYDRNQGDIKRLNNTDCQFGYRDSIFRRDSENRYVILNITLRLGRHKLRTGYKDLERSLKGVSDSSLTPVQVSEAVIRLRRRKLPGLKRFPNVGSVFKNPVISRQQAIDLNREIGVPTYSTPSGTKVSAAYLIDCSGWKGKQISGILIWPRQPLVFVNQSSKATGIEFLQVANQVREDIYSKFQVPLEMEPVVLGDVN